MDAYFTVTNRRSRCCEVIELAGELDLASAHHLEAVLDRMLVAPNHLVADTTQLTFLDSSGLRLLLRASNMVEGRIWLKGASLHIRKVIDIMGLTDRFCFEEDPDMAHRVITNRDSQVART